MSKEAFFNPMEEAYRLVSVEDRNERMKNARRLAGIIQTNLQTVRADLVTGEAGVPVWRDATDHLVGRKSMHRLEAWMVAELVAAGVASAHELTTMEVVSEEAEFKLANHLTQRALELTSEVR